MTFEALIALVPPISTEQRLVVSCIGAFLGWMLVRQQGFGKALPLLLANAGIATLLGVMLERVDFTGLFSFLTSVIGSALFLLFMRRPSP